MKPEIRALVIKDADEIFALWQAAGLHPSRSDTVEALRLMIEREPDLFLVAEEEGRIIGTVWGGFDGRRGWIYRLAVAPSHQGLKLGKRLMDEVEARLKAKGCTKVNLLIERDNIGVVNFYAARGYNEDDVAFMEKWLG